MSGPHPVWMSRDRPENELMTTATTGGGWPR